MTLSAVEVFRGYRFIVVSNQKFQVAHCVRNKRILLWANIVIYPNIIIRVIIYIAYDYWEVLNATSIFQSFARD